MTQHFHGVIPPVVTPLTADGQLDLSSFRRSLDRMITAGVHGVFTLGSSGEVAFSTDGRRKDIIEAVMKIVDGRVPVFVAASIPRPTVLSNMPLRPKKLGASAIVATAPFYALGGLPEIERHFRLIHEAVPELPLFAYDIPVCVHVKLSNDMLIRLGRDGVLTGVKDSSNDDVAFRFLVDANADAGHPLTLLTGQEIVVDGAYMRVRWFGAGAGQCGVHRVRAHVECLSVR